MELSDRQLGIMHCIAACMSSASIAAFYKLKEKTIKNELTKILKLTGCKNRENLVWWWYENVA